MDENLEHLHTATLLAVIPHIFKLYHHYEKYFKYSGCNWNLNGKNIQHSFQLNLFLKCIDPKSLHNFSQEPWVPGDLGTVSRST